VFRIPPRVLRVTGIGHVIISVCRHIEKRAEKRSANFLSSCNNNTRRVKIQYPSLRKLSLLLLCSFFKKKIQNKKSYISLFFFPQTFTDWYSFPFVLVYFRVFHLSSPNHSKLSLVFSFSSFFLVVVLFLFFNIYYYFLFSYFCNFKEHKDWEGRKGKEGENFYSLKSNEKKKRKKERKRMTTPKRYDDDDTDDEFDEIGGNDDSSLLHYEDTDYDDNGITRQESHYLGLKVSTDKTKGLSLSLDSDTDDDGDEDYDDEDEGIPFISDDDDDEELEDTAERGVLQGNSQISFRRGGTPKSPMSLNSSDKDEERGNSFGIEGALLHFATTESSSSSPNSSNTTPTGSQTEVIPTTTTTGTTTSTTATTAPTTPTKPTTGANYPHHTTRSTIKRGARAARRVPARTVLGIDEQGNPILAGDQLSTSQLELLELRRTAIESRSRTSSDAGFLRLPKDLELQIKKASFGLKSVENGMCF
jgi:hypothetical protein